jgi:hypothetical protein
MRLTPRPITIYDVLQAVTLYNIEVLVYWTKER